MTKQEMINKYNFYVRKRNEYNLKIESNEGLRQIINSGLFDCNDSMKKIGENNDSAEIFNDLYLRNYNRYCIAQINQIMDIFDEVNSHLVGVRDSSQNSIDYWNNKINNYQEEEE